MLKSQSNDIKSEIIEQKKLQVKLKLIVNAIKRINDKNINDKEKFQKQIAEQSYIDAFKLDANTVLLGVKAEVHKPYSYADIITIRNECFAQIEQIARPLIIYFNKKRNDTSVFNVFQIKQTKQNIDVIDRELKEKYQQLAIVTYEKVILLEKVAKIKNGTYQKDQLHLDYLKSKVTDLKSKLIADMILHEICFRTEYATRAMKKIEKYLDEQL